MNHIFKLKLQLKSGLLSKLDSDTIFGHFCWRLKELKGEDALNAFLDSYRKDEPVFSISNAFLEDSNYHYFPRPLLITPFENGNSDKKAKIGAFIRNKRAKQNKFISMEMLNEFLNDTASISNKYLEKNPSLNSILKINVQIDRETFGSYEGNLYSYNPVLTDKTTYHFVLIKVLDPQLFEKFNCSEVLTSLFELGFGRRKSIGYGQFEIINFSEFEQFHEPEESNGFISLSNYLPSSNENIKNAYYDTYLKYGKLGEQFANYQNPFKKPALFLKAGSCFLTDKKQAYYGRITKEGEIYDYNRNIIQNGITFSLNFKTE